MAFDGFVVANLVRDLKDKLVGGHVSKISQPEKDEIILTIKNYSQYRLDISAQAALPLVYLTDENKPALPNAPGFTMLLRKHLSSAKIVDIDQPDMERVIRIKLVHYDELGDLKTKWLIVELMGKYSNIIFTDDNFVIIDSIKRISSLVSSVREVLPGRDYFIPKTVDKKDASALNVSEIGAEISGKNCDITKAVYTSFTGFSSLTASEAAYLAGVDATKNVTELTDGDIEAVSEIVKHLTDKMKNGEFEPNIVLKNGEPYEFSCFNMRSLEASGYEKRDYEDISKVLIDFYSMKAATSRISQKSASLRKLVNNAVEREAKKLDLLQNQLRSTEKKDKYKVYGDLLTTYGYSVKPGEKSLTCENFYNDNKEITIPLDETKTAMENAKRYFDRYAKLKRTGTAVTEQIAKTEEELYHLTSVKNALDIATCEGDLDQIRKELADFGYAKKAAAKNGKKERKEKNTTAPLHFLTPEGYEIFVGKNNYQNDELTFKFASANDWWFHAKKIPGSHVVLKDKGEEIPDIVFERAAACAAFYSSGKTGGKVDVDYLKRKDVKKPSGSKPGFVVYYTNYSMTITPSLEGLNEVHS
ncbi:MAG: NFACT family protein [Lachnospiraceae bacterium]|nr:NFACT family protein [Lachnospiraceae bacterium]